MEVGLFKSELLLESTTKLGIVLFNDCDFAGVSLFIVFKVLINLLFSSLHFLVIQFLFDKQQRCFQLTLSLNAAA